MYIELFLLDNLLMNLLSVWLAAALLSVRPPLYRQAAAVIPAAVYSAAAAYLWPVLGRPWLRILPLLAMALALPFTSLKGYLTGCAAMLFATLAAGGAALCTAFLTGGNAGGGFITAGIPLRAALLGALGVSLLPRAARRLMKRRIRSGTLARLTVEHRGIKRGFTALVDTGDLLTEPVTGLPAAVVFCPALKAYAKLPLRVNTAAGEHVLYAFRPEKVFVDGTPVDCVIALAARPMSADAVIPPELCRETNKTE